MNWQRGAKILLTLLISGSAAIPAQAQMKLGGKPGATRLDAVLELGSQRKGLLLPRVTNTALASNPLDSAAQGMMVFNIDDQTLYIKKTNGYAGWNKLPDLSTFALANMSDVNYPTLPAIDQLLRYNGTKWSNWTPNYIKTISGDVTAGAVDAAGNVVTTLSNFGTAGTYPKVTVDAKGRVQSGAALVAADIPSLATFYIQNQNAALQTGDFRIGGNGNMGSLTVTNNAAVGSLNITGLTTPGAVLFTSNTGLVSQKAAQFVWDNTNNRLGIGTAAPSTALHVTGDLRVTGLNKTGGILFTAGTDGVVGQKNAELVWDNTNDRLGIGTGTPATSLDVAGDFKLGSTGTILTSIFKTTITIPTTAIGSRTTVEVIITLPAGTVLKLTDAIILNPTAAMSTGISIGYCRVSNVANRQIAVGLVNAATAKNFTGQVFNATFIQ